MKGKTKIGLLVLLVVFIGVSVFLFNKKKETNNVMEDKELVEVSQVNPSISFKSESGEVYDVDELKGKVLFVNFWATWCPPCKAEMPSIQKLYDKFKNNDDIVFLIVEIENDIVGANKFLEQENLTLPIVYPNSGIPETWLAGAIPTTVIVNKLGVLSSREEGMRDYSTKSVENFINKLIDQ